MNKKIKIEVPEFLTLKQFSQLSKIDHLTDLNKMIRIISVITEIEEEEIKTWSIKSIGNISDDLANLMLTEHEFYPIIKVGEIEYGFVDIRKMTIGEFADLEELCKDYTKNINRVTSLLYRPVTKNRLGSQSYKIKNGVAIKQGKVANIFDYYEVEKYDNIKNRFDAPKWDNFPSNMAMGAMVFFLGIGILILNDTQFSEVPLTKEVKEIMESMTMENTILKVGDGLASFIASPKNPKSLPLTAIAV